MTPEVRITGLLGLPEVRPKDDLAGLVLEAAERQRVAIQEGDVLVVTHKVVSKAEGRVVDLRQVKPSPFALRHAKEFGKDPRQVELVLQESRRIVRMDKGVLITETWHGFVCANAGVDTSNAGGQQTALLLPQDPDASAERMRREIETRTGASIAVIISDTFGRPWREGLTNVAIGVAGLRPLLDYRGESDPTGQKLHVTVLAIADELASAAELVMGKLSRVPVAIIRGYSFRPGRYTAKELIREPSVDLFR